MLTFPSCSLLHEQESIKEVFIDLLITLRNLKKYLQILIKNLGEINVMQYYLLCDILFYVNEEEVKHTQLSSNAILMCCSLLQCDSDNLIIEVKTLEYLNRCTMDLLES